MKIGFRRLFESVIDESVIDLNGAEEP